MVLERHDGLGSFEELQSVWCTEEFDAWRNLEEI